MSPHAVTMASDYGPASGKSTGHSRPGPTPKMIAVKIPQPLNNVIGSYTWVAETVLGAAVCRLDVSEADSAARADGLNPLAISQTAMTISCTASGPTKKPSESPIHFLLSYSGRGDRITTAVSRDRSAA